MYYVVVIVSKLLLKGLALRGSSLLDAVNEARLSLASIHSVPDC